MPAFSRHPHAASFSFASSFTDYGRQSVFASTSALPQLLHHLAILRSKSRVEITLLERGTSEQILEPAAQIPEQAFLPHQQDRRQECSLFSATLTTSDVLIVPL